MKELGALLLLLLGIVLLWQGPVVMEFFNQHVEVTTAEERAAARLEAQAREARAKREAEAQVVSDEIVRLAAELDGKNGAKAPAAELKQSAPVTKTGKDGRRNRPEGGNQAPQGDAPTQPM